MQTNCKPLAKSRNLDIITNQLQSNAFSILTAHERERAEQTTMASGEFAQNQATLQDYINFAQFSMLSVSDVYGGYFLSEILRMVLIFFFPFILIWMKGLDLHILNMRSKQIWFHFLVT